MRKRSILLSDYAGHPFTTELARTLSRRGVPITYSYCAGTTTPRGLAGESLDVVGLVPGLRFEKYRPLRRVWTELRYGIALTALVWRRRPDLHVVCNMPLVTAATVWLLSLPLRARLGVWFQDVQSGLAAGSLGDGWSLRALSALETFVLRRAWRVIAISGDLADEAGRRGVRPERIRELENWAPLATIPVLGRDTRWAVEHGLGGGLRFVYAGTLGRKHDPSLLVELARELVPLDGQVVVVSEGEGADYLRDEQRLGRAPGNIAVVPYQPFDRLPEVLASADVLVVVLDVAAGRYSVPSKTLSYLCAQRPILASMPADNDAAVILTERAGAGLVADAGDRGQFLAYAADLARDPELRDRLARAGRRYAEANFDEHTVADRFLAVLDDRQ
jgi:glycosyltransferase involved in cell wall biosynthesis